MTHLLLSTMFNMGGHTRRKFLEGCGLDALETYFGIKASGQKGLLIHSGKQSEHSYLSRQIPREDNYNVIVAGGPAGSDAAVCSARPGAITTLREWDAYLPQKTLSKKCRVRILNL